MTPQTITPADEAVAEFLASLAIVRERRARGELLARPRSVDGARLASAFRAKPRPAAPATPARRAASAAAICRSCGARGEHGCDHFLPYPGETT